MTDPLSHFVNEVARKLAEGQDDLIRRVISNHIGDSWTDEAIMPRLRWERERGHPNKTLMLDGNPILIIWPPESHADFGGNSERTAMKWSVRYQEL